MTRVSQLIVAFAALALLANAAITPSSTSLTSASFSNTTVSAVMDASATANADYTLWSTFNKAYFAPGTTNGTVYLFGVNLGSGSLTKVGSRALNAYYLSNGTAAKNGDATTGTDVSETISSVTPIGTPYVGVGLGGIAIAYVATDTATVKCNQVFLKIYNGGTGGAVVTKQVTSNTCSVCDGATVGNTGTGYAITVGNVFYENSTYFVSYTQVAVTQTYAASGVTCGTTTAVYDVSTGGAAFTNAKSYVQGFAASSAATAFWSAGAANVFSTTTTITGDTVGIMCGPTNYTNSTNIACVYRNGATGATNSLVAITVPTATGTPGGTTTIATDVLTSSSGNAAYVLTTWTLAGFIYSEYQQGYLLNNATTAGTAPTYSNNLNIYNTTSGAASQTVGGTIIASTYTNAISSAPFAGSGVTYSQGYVILDNYKSAATPTVTYEYSPFLSNSTANGSRTTVATTDGTGAGNWFVDANGALWFGGYTLDTTASPNVLATASVGKVVGQIYYSAGNILASFVALLSVMIAALFAF